MWTGIALVVLVVAAFFSPKLLKVKGAEEIYELGRKHYDKGEYEEASKEFLNVLIKRPDKEDLLVSTLVYLSYCYSNLENYDLAAKCLERLVKNYPENPQAKEAVFYIANLSLQKGDYDTALETYDRFLKSATKTEFIIDTKFQMAYCHFQKKDHSKAKELLETIKTKYTSPVISLETKFLELYARIDAEKKKEIKEEEIKISTPTITAADYARIVSIIEGKYKEKAVDIEEKRRAKLEKKRIKEEIKRQYNEAVKLYKNKQMFRSTELLKTMIEKYPEENKPRALLEKIQEEMKYIKNNFHKLQRLYTGRGEQQLTEKDLRYAMGYVFYSEGKNDKSIECLEEFLTYEPKNEEVLEFIDKLKTKIQMAEKKDDEKLKLEEKKLLEKEIKQLYNEALKFYKKRQMFKSTEILKNILEKSPQHRESQALLKKITEEMKYIKNNFHKLQQLYADRGEQQLTEKDLHYVTGYLFYLEGKNSESIEHLEKFLIYEPKNEEIPEFIDKLKTQIQIVEKKDEEEVKPEEKNITEEKIKTIEEEKNITKEEIKTTEKRITKEEIKKQYKEAVKFYKKRQMFRATEILKNILEKYPQHRESQALLKKITEEMKYIKNNFHKLQQLYAMRGEQLTEKDLHYVTGYLFYLEGKNNESIEHLKKILLHEPKNEEILEFINKLALLQETSSETETKK